MARTTPAYDFVGGQAAHEDVAHEIADLIDGDVRFDAFTRTLYATDASIYRVEPVGVILPKTADDVARICAYAHAQGIAVLPRGAGTSLAGQAVNKAIVLDFTRYMNRVIAIDPAARSVEVEPGVVLADLNKQLAPHGLKFGPDPASGNRSAVGGAIGNNASGAHSLVYGMTDAYVDSVDVILDDGSRVTFEDVPLSRLEEKRRAPGREGELYETVARILEECGPEIEARYPKIKRNASGYNLSRLIRGDSINLARLMAGSEGTLGVVVKATLRLEPIPDATSLVLLSYASIGDAMVDVPGIVETGAAAVEVMDDVMLELAGKTSEFADLVRSMPTGTSSALVVEYYADSQSEADARARDLVGSFVRSQGGDGRAIAYMQAGESGEKRRLWSLRAAGLPILLSRTSDEKHIPFVEDAAIPPERLAEYVEEFQALLEKHDTYASFYAHAGPGVLHVRPLISTKTQRDLERIRSIAAAVTQLVMKYEGALSGEHGDGRSRTQWNRVMYGEPLWQAFLQIKQAFDPNWILNPGQVVYRDEQPTEMTSDLRYSPELESTRRPLAFTPQLRWNVENGFQGMVELCHGCAGCRSLDGGVMCPTFRAAQEEITSTRGRANLLREAIRGTLPQDVLQSKEFQHEVLDLCIGCKGCKRDCPSQVDLAKLKIEMKHLYHQSEGITLRERFFSRVDLLGRFGSAFAPFSNLLGKVPGAPALVERLLGITRHRPLPRFERTTLMSWFKRRSPGVDPERAVAKVKLFVDCHTNHNHPEIGRAAVTLLEAAGVYVEPASVGCCGRPALSKGILDLARSQAERVATHLEAAVSDGWEIVGIEPSCVSAMQDEYTDLLESPPTQLAAHTYEIMEYLDTLRSRGLLEQLRFPDTQRAPKIVYHGHCHQKALKKEGHAASLLAHAGFDVETVDSSCCGMAGSFGYEAEHYEMSMAIGRLLFAKIEACGEATVVAPGASCASQIAHGMGIPVLHPAVALAKRLHATADGESASLPSTDSPLREAR